MTPNELACQQGIALLSQIKPSLYIQHIDSIERLEELWRIDKQAYQDVSLELEEFSRWWQCYEFGSRVLIENDRIIASIGIYPIASEQALEFADGQITEGDLMPVSLSECEQVAQHHWYASGIVVSEDYRGEGSPLKTLLRMGLAYWMNSGHIAYPVSVMAIAEYEIGARLLSLFGFQKIRDGSTLPDGCDLYQLYLKSEQELRSLMRVKRLF